MKKPSKYNVYIRRGDISIIYNTLWCSYLICSPSISDAITHFEIDASELDSNIIDQLVDKKILIDDNIDEYEIAESILRETNEDNSKYDIIVNPTLKCNLRCWYCYESHKSNEPLTKDIVSRTIKLVRNVLDSKSVKCISLRFFGGEPLLRYNEVVSPLLSEVCKLCEREGVHFYSSMTTNGVLISASRLEFFKQHNLHDLQITLDGNRKRHNAVRYLQQKVGTYDRINSNIRDALSFGIRVSIRINISEETSLDVEDLLAEFATLDSLEKDRLSFSVHKVWQSPESVLDTVDKIVSKIRASGYKAATCFSNPVSVWETCYADKINQVIINEDGRVFKCTARDFTPSRSEGELCTDGSIEWNDLHRQRLSISPMDNESCRSCSIFPICAGGCSQKLLDHKDRTSCPAHMTLKERQDYAFRVLSEKLEDC